MDGADADIILHISMHDSMGISNSLNLSLHCKWLVSDLATAIESQLHEKGCNTAISLIVNPARDCVVPLGNTLEDSFNSGDHVIALGDVRAFERTQEITLTETSNVPNLIPVTILTGFLGSGKTTVLNHLLHEQQERRVAVIENEFGEVPIDNELLASKMELAESMVVMDNGCMCCSVRGDLLGAFMSILSKMDPRRPLDAVLVETTGMADPVPIVRTFLQTPEISSKFKLDGVVTMVDCKNVRPRLDAIEKSAAKNRTLGEKGSDEVDEAFQQIMFADRIIMNKVDLVSASSAIAVWMDLRALNRDAKILTCTRGQLKPSELTGFGAFNMRKHASLELDSGLSSEKRRKSAVAPRKTGFRISHCLEYGLAVTSTCSSTGLPEMVSCQFCAYFGREISSSHRIRRKTKNIKHFSCPFRPENYRMHHQRQHMTRWNEYKELSSAQKRIYFEAEAESSSVLKIHHNDGSSDILEYNIDAKMVDVLVTDIFSRFGNMMEFGAKKDNISVIFTKFQIGEGNSNITEKYRVIIENKAEYKFVVGLMGIGNSFQQTLRSMEIVQYELNCAAIKNCTKFEISNYSMATCAVNFQILSNLLARAWAFSITLEVEGSNPGEGYIDVRVKFEVSSKLRNFHLLTIPMVQPNSCEEIFSKIDKYLSILCSNWKSKLLSFYSKSYASNVPIRNAIARLESFSKPMYKSLIWDAYNQIIQAVFSSVKNRDNGLFHLELFKLIDFLKNQPNFEKKIEFIGPNCTMEASVQWIMSHHVYVLEHLSGGCSAPDSSWWLKCSAISKIYEHMHLYLKSINEFNQNYTILDKVQHFATSIRHLGIIEEYPKTESNTKFTMFFHGNLAISKESLLKHMFGISPFLSKFVQELNENELHVVLNYIANVFFDVFESLHVICQKGWSADGTHDLVMYNLLPHHIVQKSHRDFSNLVEYHRNRLCLTWENDEIDQIFEQYNALVKMYVNDPAYKTVIDCFTDTMTFDETWSISILKSRFQKLSAFLGGIASTMPNLNLTMPNIPNRITDFELEAILHCEQYKELTEIIL